jgi:hypothetical protein
MGGTKTVLTHLGVLFHPRKAPKNIPIKNEMKIATAIGQTATINDNFFYCTGIIVYRITKIQAQYVAHVDEILLPHGLIQAENVHQAFFHQLGVRTPAALAGDLLPHLFFDRVTTGQARQDEVDRSRRPDHQEQKKDPSYYIIKAHFCLH